MAPVFLQICGGRIAEMTFRVQINYAFGSPMHQIIFAELCAKCAHVTLGIMEGMVCTI